MNTENLTFYSWICSSLFNSIALILNFCNNHTLALVFEFIAIAFLIIIVINLIKIHREAKKIIKKIEKNEFEEKKNKNFEFENKKN